MRGWGLCTPVHLRVRKSCPECGVRLCCAKKGLCEVTGEQCFFFFFFFFQGLWGGGGGGNFPPNSNKFCLFFGCFISPLNYISRKSLPARKTDRTTYVKAKMAIPPRKGKYEGVRWSLSLAVCCAGVSAFRFPIVGVLGLVVAITTTHCAVHHHAHELERGMACSVGMCNVSVSHECS